MRAVVKVKHSQGRAPSNAARYLAADSKLDPEREGNKHRPLFTNRGDDNLTYGDANRYLNDGPGRPAKGDLIHFSVSFRGEDFEKLGATDEERKEGLRAAAREAMDGLRGDLRIRDWRWVAAIHLNTPHPHLHFLISKEITDERGKERRLGKIPRGLLPRMERDPAGDSSRPVEGKLGEHFVAALDRAQERARDRELELPDMAKLLDHSREFDKPLIHQGIEYRTVENFYQAMKTAKDDLEMRRKIAAASPNEARALGEGLKVRSDWAEIGSQVMEMALRHKFAFGTTWHAKLVATGDKIFRDGTSQNLIGDLLMQLRDTREKTVPVIRFYSSSRNGYQEFSNFSSHSIEMGRRLWPTVEHYYQAQKFTDEQYREQIRQAESPARAKEMGRTRLFPIRPDWERVKDEIMYTAVQQKFSTHVDLREMLLATGKSYLVEASPYDSYWGSGSDGAGKNKMGQLLMRVRGELREREKEATGVTDACYRKEEEVPALTHHRIKDKFLSPDTFLDKLDDGTGAWIRLAVSPRIDRFVEAGNARKEVFAEIDKQVYRRTLPADVKERTRQINEGIRINDFLKSHVDLKLFYNDRLLEFAGRNTSPAGRELTRELIPRGPHQGYEAEPDIRNDLREAFRDRHLSDTGYQTQYGKAGWLDQFSSELRDMHERGAVIKEDILVIPAEPHELNSVVNDRQPFMNELPYAFNRIRHDPKKAVEFYTLAKAIAGRTADAKTEIEYFKYYYDLIEKEKGGEQGRPLGKGETEAREEALDIVLGKMRALAPEMEQLESRVSVELKRPGLVDSLEVLREVEASHLPDDEQEHMPEPADIIESEERGSDISETEAMEREPEARSFIFNTSARNVNLNDESLRLPGGLTFEDRKSLVSIHMPNVDAKLESGMAQKEILSGIDVSVEEWNHDLPEKLTTKQREWVWVKNQRMGDLLKSYVAERLKDPERRARNRSAVFRAAHANISEARTPDELNRAADAIRSDDRFNERHRRLLFFGRAPDHHTPEMRELRRMWWLPQKELVNALSEKRLAPSPALKELIAELDLRDSKVKPGLWSKSQGLVSYERVYWQKELVIALSDGRLAPSPALYELITELDSRNSRGRVNYFYSALKNAPENMQKPEESVRLGLWPKSQGLDPHELTYLLDLTWEKRQSFTVKNRSLRETIPQLDQSPLSSLRVPHESESFREYKAEVKDREQSLLASTKSLTPEERLTIREKASRQAWDRLVPPEVFAEHLSEAALALSETIAELQEKAQPQARIADRVLNEFSLEKTGHPYGQIPQEARDKLSPPDLARLNKLEKYAAETREKLYLGFEKIDGLHQEIELARGDGADRTPISADATETKISAQREETVEQNAPPANRSAAKPTRESPSYREYMAGLGEIERQLLDEEIKKKQPEKEVREITQANGLFDRKEKLSIRAIAASFAWKRIAPLEILTNDPAVTKLLSLEKAIEQLRDKAQPQAREAAAKVDGFIRSRNLDQYASQKTDYYYRADQIPKAKLENLSSADKREFVALERHAAATLREFKNGFSAIDSLRMEIENSRNGAGDPPALNGNGHLEGRGSTNGGGNHSLSQISDREAAPGPPGKDPTRDTDRERKNDRIILGNAIIAHARADAAALNYETARDHGHTFRFNIHDESIDGERRISELDVNRRADARGNRAADERGAERSDDRRAIRGSVSDADLNYHSTTLKQHDQRLDWLVKQLEDKANVAHGSYQHARQLAQEVLEKYQERGELRPTPFVGRETLVETQDEAIKHSFAGHTERLERLREALAEEHGQPARSDREAARLAAQLFTANTEMKAQEDRAGRFDETRHLRQWEIGGEKFSLADIDRQVERLSRSQILFSPINFSQILKELKAERPLFPQIQLADYLTNAVQSIGNYEIKILPGERRQVKAEIERLSGIRDEITRMTGEHQAELREQVAEAGKLLDTLTRASERETMLREQSGQAMREPQFTRQELERAAGNIETTRDAAALRQLSAYERQFNSYADQKERFRPDEEWGRAPGRALMASIFLRESNERLLAFEQRGEIQPLLVETPDGHILTHRLQDTQVRSLIETDARSLIEPSLQPEIRERTQAAFAEYKINLEADLEKTRSYQEAAMGVVLEQVAERNQLAGRELPATEIALTPKQAMTLEIYAEKQAEPEVRDRILSLARDSVQTYFDPHFQARSPEPAAAREAAPDVGRGR